MVALAILVFIIVLVFILATRRGLPKHHKKVIEETRGEDIISTLNPKEKQIVSFLMDNGNKSNQANIRHNTGIPRTSLSRCLKSLEAKKIVTIEEIGKMRKVSLTPWFLGKR